LVKRKYFEDESENQNVSQDDEWPPTTELLSMLNENELEELHDEIYSQSLDIQSQFFERFGEYLSSLKEINAELEYPKGPIPDYPTLTYISTVASVCKRYFGDSYRISAADRSKFRNLIELTLPEAGVEIGSEMIKVKIKQVINSFKKRG